MMKRNFKSHKIRRQWPSPEWPSSELPPMRGITACGIGIHWREGRWWRYSSQPGGEAEATISKSPTCRVCIQTKMGEKP